MSEEKKSPPAPPPKAREPKGTEKTVTRHPNKMIGGGGYVQK